MGLFINKLQSNSLGLIRIRCPQIKQISKRYKYSCTQTHYAYKYEYLHIYRKRFHVRPYFITHNKRRASSECVTYRKLQSATDRTCSERRAFSCCAPSIPRKGLLEFISQQWGFSKTWLREPEHSAQMAQRSIL